jgi:SdpI/YfhL protein family
MKQMMWSLMLASTAMTNEQAEQFGKIMMFVTFFSGLGFIVISIPLLYEKIKPNGWYGFRTQKTLSSEEIWYKANKYMSKDLIKLGCLIILYNLVVFILKIDPILVFGNLIITGVGPGIVMLRSFLYLRKL